MCFGSDEPQAPNNAPTYSTDQAKAASAAATVAKDPTQDDSLNNGLPKVSQNNQQSSASGSNIANLGM